MTRGPLVLGAGLAAGLLLQGCATKPVVYGPIGPEAPYGYSELKNPDGGFTVRVAMPGYSGAGELRAFFDRRAAELCSEGVDRTNVFRVHANEGYPGAPYVHGGAGISSRVRMGVELEGYVYCKAAATASKAAADAS